MVFDGIVDEIASATFDHAVSGDSISNNKIGAAVGGIGAMVALSAVGVSAAPVTLVALGVGAMAGSKGEAATKGVAGLMAKGTTAVAGGALKLTGGVLNLAALGIKGGIFGLHSVLKSDEARFREAVTYLEGGDYVIKRYSYSTK